MPKLMVSELGEHSDAVEAALRPEALIQQLISFDVFA
jgi:hypothetical protein